MLFVSFSNRRGARDKLPARVNRMKNFEQEDIKGELKNFALRESIQDSTRQHRKEANSGHFTWIMSAIQKGDVAALQQLSEHQSSFREQDSRGWLPLHRAAVQPHTQVLEAVLQASTELTLEELTANGDTALILAVEAGLVENVTALLKHGASPHNTNDKNESPLLLAVRLKCYEMAFALMMGGAFVDQVCQKKRTALHEAAKVGCPTILMLLLRHGAKVSTSASYTTCALRTLLPLTTERAIRISGHSPVHLAADGGQSQCLQLLIDQGFDVNVPLETHMSENYGDRRRSALYFAVCNGDVTCAQMLLEAGARSDLDPLRCILVAIRAERYELVRLLLSHGADVNCYFNAISHTVFPTGLQYCLRDPLMRRLLFNSGYDAYKCFQCCCGDSEELDSSWAQLHNQVYQIYSQPDAITFCEFVSVSWLERDVVGGVVRMLLDYVSYVHLCPKLRKILEDGPEWEDISGILNSPRSLQHLSRLVVRSHISPKILNSAAAMAEVPLPPRVKNYLSYREYDLHGDI
uniref:SOCS box domain-containing protein n=1 Tax=Knipowitschia caucasica TaxID=637954 RepID=A0AAV2J0X2_KNICA